MDRHKTIKESALNLVFNVMSMVVSMALSFWITPYLTNSIGSEGYGLIPLTQQFVNYTTVITISITSISGRYFAIARRRENDGEAQEYFSSTLYATIVTILILLIPFVMSSFMIDKIINIPNGFLDDVRKTYVIFIAVFIITFITSAFNDGPFSENKLFYTSGISIVNVILKSAVTVSLCLMFEPRIWFVSVGVFAGAIVSLVLSVIVFRRIIPDIKITLKPHNRVKDILSSGMWISIGEIGVILFLQIDLFVSNHFVSLKEAGEYAVVLQLPSVIRTFSGTIVSIFVPVVVALYAAGDMEGMKKYVNNAVKYTGIVLSLPIGILCGLGGTLLSLWINPDFAKYQLVLAVLSVHLSINLSVQAVTSVETAMAKVKIPAFMTLIMGTINFGLACFFAGPMKIGVLGIALAGGIVLTCKNFIFSPIYVAYITKSKWYTYFPGVIKPFCTTVGVSIFCYFVQQNIYIPNLLAFVGVCCVIGIIYLIVVWAFMINRNEKQQILKYIRKRVNKQ